MARTRDQFGYDLPPVATDPLAPVDIDPLTGMERTNISRGEAAAPAPILTPVGGPITLPGESLTPAVPKAGAGLDTIYGIDSESYLTDDQRKLARMIQGKFDASGNRRDRELARWGSPALAGDVRDEALARAMSLASGLNAPVPVTQGIHEGGNGSSNVRPLNTGGTNQITPLIPKPTDTAEKAGPSTYAQMQQILSGISSLVPLLFGKDAYGNFMNKGALQWLKEKLFGADAASMITDESLQRIVETGAIPTIPGMTLNPITGMPMAVTGNMGDTSGLPYGAGSGWGDDLLQTGTVDTGSYTDWWDDPASLDGWWNTIDPGTFDYGNEWDFGFLGGA
jgi:hypothetical protein